MSRTGKFRHDEKGAAAIEFALVLLPFLLLVVGTIEYGRMLWTHQALQSLAISTARCMGVPQDACSASGSYSSANTTAYAINQASALGVSITAANIALSANANCGAVSGFSSVEISYTFSTVIPLVGALVGGVPLSTAACFPNQI